MEIPTKYILSIDNFEIQLQLLKTFQSLFLMLRFENYLSTISLKDRSLKIDLPTWLSNYGKLGFWDGFKLEKYFYFHLIIRNWNQYCSNNIMKDNAELNFIALMKHKHKHGLILNCLFETTFTFRSILLVLDWFVNLSSECKGNCKLKGNSLQEKKTRRL